MFTNPLLLIAGIVAFGLVAVVFPIAIGVYRQFQGRKVITCPHTHDRAGVTLSTGFAALGAAVGRPVIRVKRCTLWPVRKGCDEHCIAENWPELH